jgi:hypothetical protein
MASPSSSNNGGLNMLPMTAQPVSEKLTKLNHPTWSAQVLVAIRGARLEGFLIGKTEAPTIKIVSKDNDGKTIKPPNQHMNHGWHKINKFSASSSPHCQRRSFQAQPQNQLQH